MDCEPDHQREEDRELSDFTDATDERRGSPKPDLDPIEDGRVVPAEVGLEVGHPALVVANEGMVVVTSWDSEPGIEIRAVLTCDARGRVVELVRGPAAVADKVAHVVSSR